MENRLSAFITLIFLFSCGGETVYENSNRVTEIFPEIHISNETFLYVDKNENAIDGNFIAKYDNGSIQADLNFENGMISEGSIWGEDGELHLTFSIEDGLAKQRAYHKNGHVATESVFENNIKDLVVFNVWYEDGSPFYESDSTKTRMWHENGQLEMESFLIDGRINGKVIYWHENGQKAAENHFTDDEPDGTFKEWDEEGNLISEKVYEKGELISENLPNH